MKVLLSAYACEPGQGSEEGVGWNIALATAQNQETWVLTRTFYRTSIENELALNPICNLYFVYFEPLGWSGNWKNTQGVVQFHYYLWQVWAFFIAYILHGKHSFNIIHHVTYVKFWSPSFLALLPIPFIWGPVGGGEAAPRSFWKDFRFRAMIYEILRDLAQKVGEKDPFTIMTARRSAIAYATTNETAKRVEKLGAPRVQVLSEAGLSPSEISYLANLPTSDRKPLRFISFGRLLHWKGYHLSVKAFLSVDLPQAEYWIVGDGPERKYLQSLVDDAKAVERVKFWGRLPRKETLEKLSQCHVVLHPSLHDSGGWTCLESMASGRPVICLDLGGPSVQVPKDAGIKIPAINPEQTISDLAATMGSMAENPELIEEMGKAGRLHIKKNFNWWVKGEFYNQEYQKILEK